MYREVVEMPTDEERREIARKLRRLADRHDGVAWTLVEKHLGLVSDERFLGSSIYTSDSVLHVAGLIEPEPERTCRMTKIGGERVLVGWWECSECGPVYPPCKDEIAKWALQKCPRCGAKVIH